MKIRNFILTFFLTLTIVVNGQDRFDILDEKLNQLAKNYPGINEKVELSVTAATIQDFVRAIGTSNNLNVTVDPTLDIKITNSFKKVTAKEVFIFLCKRYDLDISFVGPIMNFGKYTTPIAPVKIVSGKKINLKYDNTADLLSYELANDTLSSVTKEITKQSGKNIVYSPDLSNKLVNGFMQSAPFNSALEKLAFANDLKITLSPDNFYIIEKKQAVIDPKNNTAGVNNTNFGSLGANNTPANKTSGLIVKDGLISADLMNTPINEIVNSVSKDLNKNYFLFSELKGYATVKISDATYDDFLKYI